MLSYWLSGRTISPHLCCHFSVICLHSFSLLNWSFWLLSFSLQYLHHFPAKLIFKKQNSNYSFPLHKIEWPAISLGKFKNLKIVSMWTLLTSVRLIAYLLPWETTSLQLLFFTPWFSFSFFRLSYHWIDFTSLSKPWLMCLLARTLPNSDLCLCWLWLSQF